jgi:predicted ATPase
VQEIVADALMPATEDVAGLAAIIHGKTLGNPFFVRSFLGYLHEVNLLWFDQTGNRWQWRLDKISGANLPGDVVELFALKLRRLGSDSRDLFSQAACLGNRFDLQTLSIISGRPSAECLALLFSDQARSLLLPLDGGKSDKPAQDPRAPGECTFLHDRVQPGSLYVDRTRKASGPSAEYRPTIARQPAAEPACRTVVRGGDQPERGVSSY